MIEIKHRLDEIQHRIEEINNFVHIYNITDEDSIKSITNEIEEYKKEIKKISDEKLK